jgi:hypothetical protein
VNLFALTLLRSVVPCGRLDSVSDPSSEHNNRNEGDVYANLDASCFNSFLNNSETLFDSMWHLASKLSESDPGYDTTIYSQTPRTSSAPTLESIFLDTKYAKQAQHTQQQSTLSNSLPHAHFLPCSDLIFLKSIGVCWTTREATKKCTSRALDNYGFGRAPQLASQPTLQSLSNHDSIPFSLRILASLGLRSRVVCPSTSCSISNLFGRTSS